MAKGILNPDDVRLGAVDADGDLKPGLVNDTYTGGPATASQLKPSLVTPEGALKPGLLQADGSLKPGIARWA